MPMVLLSRVVADDASGLIQANQESRDYHRPCVEPFTDTEGFITWFGRFSTGPNVGLVVRQIGSRDVVGVVTLSEVVAGDSQSAYLGYYGMARHSGRGLMTAALRLAIQFAFCDLDIHRLEANIQPSNNRSIALVRRLGFKREGFSKRYLIIGGAWRDHERWALLADEHHRVS
jgi:[ribosomal protein S5]-alanine N-acetyltransferase